MFARNSTKKRNTPFTELSLQEAYGQEVHMFLHCHLRGYDREGEGKCMDATFFDKYGAPIHIQNSWTEGYHAIENVLAEHFCFCIDEGLDCPLVAGVGGGAHLYKPIHGESEQYKPWNCTGWVPLQRRWLCEGKFYSNRHFMAIRGNEIQNNLWDYDPYGDPGDLDQVDKEHHQLQPVDKYRGGYYFYGNPFARYLHIISLKSHVPESGSGRYKRFNYIVHPLAYRSLQDCLPDNSVDGMQWCVFNIPKEEHFGPEKPWGEKVNAIEIFNDYTYNDSYQPRPDKHIYIHNGEDLKYDKMVDGEKEYIYWFDTYPFEFCEFLLDSALARGVYVQTLAGNDAFYKRIKPPEESTKLDQETVQRKARDSETAPHPDLGEPLQRYLQVANKAKDDYFANPKTFKMKEERLSMNPKLQTILEFLQTLPYRFNSVFGFTTLIDTRQKLKEIVFRDGKSYTGLEDAELLVMDYLIEGRLYCSTGVYDLFEYDLQEQVIPYTICHQSDLEKPCYLITPNMDLVFIFARCKKKNSGLIWRYTIMSETMSSTLKTTHGYFRLNASKRTKLDLSKSYDKQRVKWLYFTAIHPHNPQRRAWFSAIKGLAFGDPKCNEFTMPELTHNVTSTKSPPCDNFVEITQDVSPILPLSYESKQLDFVFPRCTQEQKEQVYVYFMQVNSCQPDVTLDATKKSSKVRPPRILQSVNGYFTLSNKKPTRLNLSIMWDKGTVKGGKVHFYSIDRKTGQPTSLLPKPKPYQ